MNNDLQTQIANDIAEVKAMMLQQKTVFTPREAAQYMGIALSYLYKLTSAGTLPFSKPGGKLIYFSKKSLDDFLLSNPTKSREVKETLASTYVATH